ncbi:hypothetical protein FQN53_003117 [Emmonsiellopsis sp. PD_33]|nr:hypothetical protein FQN53_003117 [Emmonsiellopsis sp. PD_33]
MSATSKTRDRPILPKQPLSKPNPVILSNSSARPADLQLKSTATTTTIRPASDNSIESGSAKGKLQEGEEEEVPVIEFDSSRAPQPFLEGEEVLERMKEVRGG